MAHSFGVVEEKLQEAEFFLVALRDARPGSFDSRCYFSAFVSAARSVTFALQFSLKDVRGFDEWYAAAQAQLRADPLGPHFVEIRNDLQKKGLNPLNQVSIDHLREHLFDVLTRSASAHFLVLPRASDGDTAVTDALRASTDYFVALVSLVFRAYERFKTAVDPRWYFTQPNFEDQGRTLEDALMEFGFPPGWFAGSPSGPEAWRALRAQQPLCPLNPVFEKYLGMRIEGPDDAA